MMLAMNELIVDITHENAQQYLVDESSLRPVLLDFWADWCEPCKTLLPLLEKLAHEYAGQFLLARINADEYQSIAQQLGVRSLPTVMVFKDGQPVDGFSGLQPEKVIRELLQKYLPAPWQRLIDEANTLIAEDKVNDALPLLRQAYQESGEQPAMGIGLAQVCLLMNRLSDAAELLGKIPLADQGVSYEQAMAQLKLKQEAAVSPELQALEAEHQAAPDDFDICYKLAIQYSQCDRAADALELLLSILRRDMNYSDGAVKKTMTDMLVALGKGHPVAIQYQRKFYALLY